MMGWVVMGWVVMVAKWDNGWGMELMELRSGG